MVKIASPDEPDRIVTRENVPFSFNGNYEEGAQSLRMKMPNAGVVFERTHSYLRLLTACSKIARTNVKVGKTRLLSLIQLRAQEQVFN